MKNILLLCLAAVLFAGSLGIMAAMPARRANVDLDDGNRMHGAFVKQAK